MKQSLALFSLLGIVALTPFALSAEKKTPEQYWAGTGLSTGVVLNEMKMFNPERCYQSLQSLRACVGALNALAMRTEPKSRLVPNAVAEDASFKFGAPLKRYVGLSLVKLPVEGITQETFRAAWAKEEAKRVAEDAGLKGLFDFRRNAAIDFEGIAKDLLPQAVKSADLDALAASQMVSAFVSEAVDAHARIEATEELEASTADADESFAGIGTILQSLAGKLILATIIEGSPAEKAGARAQDILKEIDGGSVEGKKADEVVKLIRGPVGTRVKLKVLRDGKEISLDIVRDTIKQDNLEAKVVSDLGRKIGVIKLRSFMDKNACGKMGQKLLSLENTDKVEGIVLDLRGNGGGLLDQAVCMGGLFFGKKVVVKVRDLQGNTFKDLFGSLPAATALPVVALIDAGSASASEVLSGALQDQQRAWILGERSFGKGSVQAPSVFAGNEKIVLYKTVQRFYQPLGRTNQIVGIEPNFVRPIKPNATEEERFALRERDYFPNALDAESQAWVETRKEKVTKVESCVASGKLAEKKYAELTAARSNADYQLLAAQEVLGCDK